MTSIWSLVVPQAEASSLSRNGWIMLLLVAFLAMTPGLTSVPTMDRDEARYSQASTQMLETGDFIDIRFQEEVRYVKPVGIYWMQALSTLPFGGENAPIGAYRIPSLLGGVIAVLLTAWLGARVFGAQVGLAAGLILALSLGLQGEVRTAKTDAALLAAGLFAQSALFMLMLRVEEARPKFWGWPAVFWAASGMALLIKGPIILMMSALTLASFALLRRDWRLLLKLRPLPGIALALAIFLPWLIAITVQTGGDFLRESVGHALLGKVAEADDSHGGPLGYHTMALPLTLWPGAVLVGLAGLVAWSRRREPEIQFLLAWILPTWLVFEFVQTKLMHYTLPTAPAIALLLALGLFSARDLLSGPWQRVLHWAIVFLGVIVAILLGALVLVGEAYFDEPTSLVGLLAAALAVLAIIAILALAARPSGDRLIGVAAACCALYTVVAGFGLPGVAAIWPSERVARLVSQVEGCDALQLATAGYREPSNVFYLGTEVVLAHNGAEAGQFLLDHPSCGVAIVDLSEVEAFVAVVEAGGSSLRALGQVAGQNTVRGRDLSLTVFVLADSALQLNATDAPRSYPSGRRVW